MCLSRNPLCREASAAFAKCPLEARDEAVRTCSDLVNNRQNFRCLARNLRDPMEVRLALIFFSFLFLPLTAFTPNVSIVLCPLLQRTCPTCPLAAFTQNLSNLSSGRFYIKRGLLSSATFTQNLFYLATTTTSAHVCTEPVLLSSGCPVVTLNLFYLSFFASLTLNYSYLSSGHFYTEHILLHLWPILH